MDRNRKIEILKEILSGNPDAINHFNEDSIYINCYDSRFTKDGEPISREQFEKETAGNQDALVIRVVLEGKMMPPITSEKEALALYEQSKKNVTQL